MTCRPLRLVLTQCTLLKGTPHHHRFDGFGRPRLPSELPTCTQGVTPSNTALRSLTGLGCFTCSKTNRLIGPEFNRPTVFAGRPLLTRQQSASLQPISHSVPLLATHYPYACTRAFGSTRPLILMHCSCRCSFSCRHRGAEKPSLTSLTHPFCQMSCLI